MFIYKNKLSVSLFGFHILMVVSTIYDLQAQVVTPHFEHELLNFRNEQVLGKKDTDSISFMLLPLNISKKYYKSIDIYSRLGIKMFLLPIQQQNIYTSKLPYQLWNNGSFIPSRGLQSKTSLGINFSFTKYLSIQLHPEYHYAKNKEFDIGISTIHQRRWALLYLWYNNIDRPQKYGNESFNRLLLTQSFVKVNVGGLSFGISNENLWWGPGKYLNIIMSDNAIGFEHLSISTNKPKNTSLGNFEFQFIGGRLLESGFYPPDTALYYANIPLYYPKTNDWRLLTGYTINYQPKWIKGLFIGYNKTVNQYYKTARDRFDYFQIFNFSKNNSRQNTDILLSYSKMSSISLRWLLPEAHFEFYSEYGWTYFKKIGKGFLSNLQIGGGYLIGFSKIFPTKQNTYFEWNMELLKLQQPPTYSRDNINSFYIHPVVRHGYTHKGEILGSAAGPGSNVIITNFSWNTQNKKFGLDFERVTNNNDFYFYDAGRSNLSFTNFWIDYGIGSSGNWKVNHFDFGYKFLKIYSFNYEWGSIPAPEPLFSKGKDRNNLFFKLSQTYRF